MKPANERTTSKLLGAASMLRSGGIRLIGLVFLTSSLSGCFPVAPAGP
jgi:hypothetical protein